MESMSKVNCYYLKEVANLQQANVKPFYLSWTIKWYRFNKLNFLKEVVYVCIVSQIKGKMINHKCVNYITFLCNYVILTRL